jgi:hypothetical protein
MRTAMIASVALLSISTMARAEVVVAAPFVFVRAGGGATEIHAPFVHLHIAKRQPMQPLPAAQPGELIHAPRPTDGSAAPAPMALPHGEFARSFTPAAGSYEVDLIHPYTGCPVHVCFSLPPGCPKKVRVERGELEFDYGRTEVEIRFKKDGRVQVQYR